MMRAEDRLDSEIDHHLELLTAEYEARGMSPREARQAARRAFGGIEPMKERHRDLRPSRWLDDAARDVRYALRGLRRNPGFAVVAIATLMLGIGANTALFSVLNALMLRTLPIDRPQELVIVSRLQGQAEPDTSFSYPFYEQLRDGTPELPGLAATTGAMLRQMTLRTGDSTASPEPLEGESVSHQYFSTLGVTAFRGRLFLPADDVAGSPGVVVLSHAFWMRRFGGDQGVVGRTIALDGTPFTIVGVAAPGFDGIEVGRRAALWWPIHQFGSGPGAAAFLSEPNTEMFTVFGRLRPGVTRAEVEARMAPIHEADIGERYSRRTRRQGFELPPDQKQEFFSARLVLQSGAAGKSDLRYRYTRPLAILIGLVAIVLLVACANVANLMLARASARQTEFSVRLAIGAGRRRLVRQLVTESLLLAVVAGTLGVALAVWFSRVLVSFVPDPRVALDVSVDLRVLAFAAGTSIVTALLFGVAPALSATRRSLAAALVASRSSGGGGRLTTQHALVVVQVALSMVVLVGASLFLKSLYNLRALEPGFRPDGLTVIRVAAPGNYEPKRRTDIYRRVADDLSALPGSRAVTFSLFGTLSGANATTNVEVPGYTPAPGDDMRSQWTFAGPRFFEATGIPILEGRALSREDEISGRPVVVVDKTMADRFFGGRAVGQQLRVRSSKEAMEVVGVAANAKYRNLKEQPRPSYYIPYGVDGPPFAVPAQIAVRTAGASAISEEGVRRIVRQVDPSAAVLEYRTMQEAIDATIPEDRLLSALATLFGVLVVMVAGIGIYGVTSFAVSRRTNEIGLRMALGASRGSVLRDVIARNIGLATAGVAIGVMAALPLVREAGALLYEVEPRDPATFVFAAVLFAALSVVASLLPARRATRLDPVSALRAE